MTLFESLFKGPAALRRRNTAPLYQERVAFLTHMKEHDRKYNTLRAMAAHLLHINRTLGFSKEMRVVTMEELKDAGASGRNTSAPSEKGYQANVPTRFTCASRGVGYVSIRV
jgi:hypothetical protein